MIRTSRNRLGFDRQSFTQDGNAPVRISRRGETLRRTRFFTILTAASIAVVPVTNAQCPQAIITTPQNIAMLHWFPPTPATVTPIRADFKTAVSTVAPATGALPTPVTIFSRGQGGVQVLTPTGSYGGGVPWWPTSSKSTGLPNATGLTAQGSIGGLVSYRVVPGAPLPPGSPKNAPPNPPVLTVIPGTNSWGTQLPNPISAVISLNQELWTLNNQPSNPGAMFVENTADPGNLLEDRFASSIYPTALFASDPGLAKMAYDGSDIWVTSVDASGRNGDIYKIPTTQNAIPILYNLKYPVGDNIPTGMLFDGTDLWVSTIGGQASTIYKVDLNGNLLASVSIPAVTAGMAFDGANLWVTAPATSDIFKINVVTATITDKIFLGQGATPLGIAFDGTYMWTANNGNNTLSKVCSTTNAIVETEPGGGDPLAVAFDGTAIWVTNPRTHTLSYRLE
jgi:hypothetical protein